MCVCVLGHQGVPLGDDHGSHHGIVVESEFLACREISDNGTNIVSACNELSRIREFLQRNEKSSRNREEC